jgi:hypothetical protein
MHRAAAALRRIAADVRAGELEMLAQEMHEQRAAFDVCGRGLLLTVRFTRGISGLRIVVTVCYIVICKNLAMAAS